MLGAGVLDHCFCATENSPQKMFSENNIQGAFSVEQKSGPIDITPTPTPLQQSLYIGSLVYNYANSAGWQNNEKVETCLN